MSTSEENKTIGLSEQLGEEFKDTPELKSFKDVNALAKSYVEASKTLASRYTGVSEEDGIDEVVKKSKLFNGLQKDHKYSGEELDHKESDKLSGIFNKYGLNPKVAPRVLKDVLTVLKDGEESVKEAKAKLWKEDSSKVWKDVNNKDERIGKALAGINMSREDFESNLGDYRDNPTIQKLLSLASQQEGGAPPKPTTTNAGGDGNEGSVPVQQAVEQLDQIMRDNAYYDEKSINYGALNREADKLTKIIRDAQKKGVEVDTTRIQKSIW